MAEQPKTYRYSKTDLTREEAVLLAKLVKAYGNDRVFAQDTAADGAEIVGGVVGAGLTVYYGAIVSLAALVSGLYGLVEGPSEEIKAHAHPQASNNKKLGATAYNGAAGYAESSWNTIMAPTVMTSVSSRTVAWDAIDMTTTSTGELQAQKLRSDPAFASLIAKIQKDPAIIASIKIPARGMQDPQKNFGVLEYWDKGFIGLMNQENMPERKTRATDFLSTISLDKEASGVVAPPVTFGVQKPEQQTAR